jgi:protein ImuA
MPPLPETLQAAIRRLERSPARAVAAPVPLAPALDAALPGGGMARAALHEVFAADAGAATGFAALLAGRAGGHVLWVAPHGSPAPYPPGLAVYGLDPETLLVAQPQARDLLWTVEEALRCPALGAVIFLGTAPGLAAARRLQLAAEAGGGLGLLLRPDHPEPPPSPAHTRWRVGALPTPGPRHTLGAPRWRLELFRARAGRPATWSVTFRDGALHPEVLAAVA